MKKILVLVNSYFPSGVAISSRMLNFCRLFRDAGYKVHVITAHSQGHEDVGIDYEIEGITYEVVSKTKACTLDSFIGTPGFLKRVKSYLHNNPQDYIFMTSSTEFFRRLAGIIHTYNRNAKCFVEQCEWLDLSNYKFGKFDIRYLNTVYLRTKGVNKVNGVIAISRLLDNYFSSKCVPSICIPTILDVMNTSYVKKVDNNEKIHIVFAGSLGGSKELMKPIIEALAKSKLFRQKIVFDIYGPSENQIINNLGGDNEILKAAGSSVLLHGRIPQEKIPEVYSNSDYLIFVRPQRRSSNAGFPTKFAESMAVGTPVITNDTGDIGIYLKHNVNGYMLKDNTTEAVCQCFDHIISIDKDTYAEMRKEARKTAENSFDYRVYVDRISKYIESI